MASRGPGQAAWIIDAFTRKADALLAEADALEAKAAKPKQPN
jgi:hypothetical protein